MGVSWEYLWNVSSSSNDESSLSEQNSSLGSKIPVIIGMSEDSHCKSGSDREEGEKEEDLQEAFN